MQESLIAPTFLFRFAAPCHQMTSGWSDSGLQLSETHRLPSFGELQQRPIFADVRAGWSNEGLFLSVRVMGKKQSPWCRDSKIEDSDGLQLWIDTRDMHNIHRAGRYCHRFGFLPFGAGRQADQPVAELLAINRCRESPKPIARNALQTRSERRVDGYVLECHIPATALTGFNPNEHPRLGFSYAVIDRELGWQTFALGPEYPITENPSMWGTLDLVK